MFKDWFKIPWNYTEEKKVKGNEIKTSMINFVSKA